MLATTGADGTPHAVPVEVIVAEDRIYCWCERFSVKARNVSRDGRAAIVAYKGHAFALARGPARLLDARADEYERISTLFLEKYAREETYGNDTLIEITPARVSTARI